MTKIYPKSKYTKSIVHQTFFSSFCKIERTAIERYSKITNTLMQTFHRFCFLFETKILSILSFKTQNWAKIIVKTYKKITNKKSEMKNYRFMTITTEKWKLCSNPNNVRSKKCKCRLKACKNNY